MDFEEFEYYASLLNYARLIIKELPTTNEITAKYKSKFNRKITKAHIALTYRFNIFIRR